MFKLFFILIFLLTTVSVNEIAVVTLSDLNFTQATINEIEVEIEHIDNVDFDNPALLTQTTAYLRFFTNIGLPYFNPDIVIPYFQNFHSRAPPTFTA
tara:strand:+ start:724 stop:1014 length:291 start_codon:yes stop_codon:yes gene_type:complete